MVGDCYHLGKSMEYRFSKDIVKLYLMGDSGGVGGIWLNRDENGKIEPPEITLDKIDKGEIYR